MGKEDGREGFQNETSVSRSKESGTTGCIWEVVRRTERMMLPAMKGVGVWISEDGLCVRSFSFILQPLEMVKGITFVPMHLGHWQNQVCPPEHKGHLEGTRAPMRLPQP